MTGPSRGSGRQRRFIERAPKCFRIELLCSRTNRTRNARHNSCEIISLKRAVRFDKIGASHSFYCTCSVQFVFRKSSATRGVTKPPTPGRRHTLNRTGAPLCPRCDLGGMRSHLLSMHIVNGVVKPLERPEQPAWPNRRQGGPRRHGHPGGIHAPYEPKLAGEWERRRA